MKRSVFIDNQTDFQETTILASWNGKVPADKTEILMQRIKELGNKEKMSSFLLLELKQPLVGLILGLFFGTFGVDRFYKGDIKLGILKFLSLFILIGIIWALIDLVLVWKGIKKDNYNKIDQALSAMGV